MSTNNKVFQILVTKGNAGLPAAGSSIDSLADGQIGLFNAETNLAVDAAAIPKEVYFAVGVHKDGALADVNYSAGQVIQLENLRDINVKNYTAGKPYIFEISNFSNLQWDTEYAVKFEFRNMQVYMRQGYNMFAKTYVVKTDCGNPATPPTAEHLVEKFLEAFNADASGMFTAVPTTGATGIKVTTNPVAINQYCDINTKYYNPRQTLIIASAIGETCPNFSIGVLQEAIDEQGAGYDIAQKEYHAGGWNGRPGPYRASSAVGLALPRFKYFADKSANYDQFSITYDQYSTAGWGEYLSNLLTVIAVPTASTTTRAALVTMLNAMAVKAGTSAIKTIV